MTRPGIDYGRSRLLTAARRTHRDNLKIAAEFLEALEESRPKPPPKEPIAALKARRKFYLDEAERCQRENLPGLQKHATRMWNAAQALDAKIRRAEKC